MQNVTMSVQGSKLIMVVDLEAETHASSSGKTQIVASTEGNAKVKNEADIVEKPPVGIDLGKFYVGLNVYTK